MGTMDYIGLLPTLIDIVRGVQDRVVGYDDQIMKRFDHAVAKALRPTAKYDDLYIKNAMLHVADLIDLLKEAYDNPARIEEIDLPTYINKEEFRRLYNQIQKDKELVNVLKDVWEKYNSKDTNNRVKDIQAEIGRLDKKIDKIDERAEEIKEDTGEIKKSLGDLNENVNNRFDKLNERFDDMEYSKGGGGDDDIQPLFDYLMSKLEEKRKHHPSFRLMDIDKKLFPNGMVTFYTEALDSNNEPKKIKEIVAESWKRGETNHLMIEGEGGIGKTVTLLSLPDKFAPHPVPAIYIPLHELKEETNTIEKYIKNRVLDSKEQQYDLLQEVVKKPWNEGPHLLLLLDGFNEIPIEYRESISEDIEQWSELPGLQIITSSRFDIHQYVALRSSFSKIELQPLSEKTVSEYLVNHKIGVPDNPAVIKLITIPLLLTLYIKAETIRNDRPSPFAKFKDTKNAGLLIWNYLQCELWRYRNKKAESKACVLAMEFIAPYIAWTMQQHSGFVLDESTFFDRIEEAYSLLKRHIYAHGQLPSHIKTTIQQSLGLPNIEFVSDLLKEHLCLFINNEGEYRLMHQQFRDALAAMHLINLSYLSGDNLPKEWNTPVDHYVMQFVVALISEEEATRLWEQNRNTTPADNDATRNQLRLQGLLRNNDYSHLNFSNLDLGNISLYPYRLNRTTIKLPTQLEKLNQTRLTNKTFSVEGPVGEVNTIVVMPNGIHVVNGSNDGIIRIWDMLTGEQIKTLTGHEKWVNSVTVTADGRQIVSGSGDRTIRIWNTTETDVNNRQLKGHKNEVTSVTLTPDERLIVSGSWDFTVRIWNIATGENIKTLKGHKDKVNAVSVTPNGQQIVSGSYDGTIYLWDIKTSKLINTINAHKSRVNTIAVTPDGTQIISGSGDCTICIWDLKKGNLIKTLKGHKGGVNAVSVTPDGRHVVSSSWDFTIRIWDILTGENIKTLEGHEGGVNAVFISSNGNQVVSGSQDITIRSWDISTGENIRTLEGYKDRIIRSFLSPKEKYLVSVSLFGTVRIWDVKTIKNTMTIEVNDGSIDSIAVTQDGMLVFSEENNFICIMDIETGEQFKIRKTSFTNNLKSGSPVLVDDRTISFRILKDEKRHKIHVLPLSLIGLDFSLADIPDPEFRETLRQNGAKV